MKALVRGTGRVLLPILLSAVAMGVALTIFFWQTAHASAPGTAGGGVVSPSFGSFADDVPIQVPGYYGIEPRLKLSYTSSGMNAFAGVGWGLTGESIVERATPDRGAPHYDSSDSFFLDGQKLTANTSFGGTHVAQHQTYTRIQQDSSNNKWYVWQKDGTKWTYTPVFPSSGSSYSSTYRWALTTVQDPNGHTVTYNYWVDTNQGAYLDNITYNGYTIKFWREGRPDSITWANGGWVSFTNYRLKTIEVKAGASDMGAYKLSYITSANTGRSLLAGVQKYGTDVTLDGSGAVTGGTSLPAENMTYYNPSGSGYASWSSNNVTGGWNTANKILYGDVNGDGKMDQVTIWQNGSNAYAQVRQSNGTDLSYCSFNASVGGWNTAYEDYLMDVNGDGRADLIIIHSPGDGNSYAQINLSDGLGFPTQAWNGNIGAWDGTHITIKDFFGDVNGDGKTDLIRVWKNGTSVMTQVNLWSDSTYWANWTNVNVGGWGDNNVFLFGDVNGDGKVDMVLMWPHNNWVNAQINTSDGSNFGNFNWNQTIPGGGGFDTTSKFSLTDMNKDGKADLVQEWNNGGNTCVTVWGGYGYAFPWTMANTNVGSWDTRWRDFFVDVNGDGLPDFVRVWTPDNTNAKAQVNLNNGLGGYPTQAWNGVIGGWDTTFVDNVTDMDGDNKADLTRVWNAGGGNAKTQMNDAKGMSGTTPVDLLVTKTNGMGGTTTVAYTPSTAWPSQYLPRGGAFPTVSSVVVDDGRGVSGQTTYSYADSKYSVADKAFLGFGYQKAIVDDQSTYVETYSRQTVQSMGQPSDIYTKNSAGLIFARTNNVFTEGGNGQSTPYTSLITQINQYEYNLASGARQKRSTIQYDAYANPVQIVDEGDIGVTGDEITKVSNYNPNTSNFIVSKVASEQIYADTYANSAKKQSDVQFYYDGASLNSAFPVTGNMTRVDTWNSQSGQYETSTGTFDSYGNQISVTNARGYTSTTDFDTTYHTFPVKRTNAQGQTSTQVWDYVKNVVTSVTNANNVTTTYVYDALGRLTSTTDAAGNISTTQYLNIGDPNNQRIHSVAPDGSADGLWTDSYKDGLGRVYKTVREGPSAGVTYIQEAVFTDDGEKPAKTSLWYQSGGSPVWESYQYDGVGRLTKQTHADGSYSTISYNMDASNKPYSTVTDEMGHQVSTWVDIQARPIHIQEKNGGSYYDTYKTYDAMGRLTQVKDSSNHTSTYTYNSLGQRLTTTDMDLGTVTDTYGLGGLLTSTTDAQGQTTSFTYDNLGRINSKTIPSLYNYEQNPGAETGTSSPDQWVTYTGGSATFTWDSATKRSGAKSVAITNPTNWSEWTNNGSATYSPSKTYTAKAWVKTSSLSTNSASIKLDYFDASWNWLGQTMSASSLGGTNDWTLIKATAAPGTAPSGTVNVKLAVIVTAAASGTVWYDDTFLDDGSGTATSNYYYDEAGHGSSIGKPTRLVYPGGSQSISYDSFGKPTSITQTVGAISKTFSKTYDALGRTATLTYPDGEVVTNGYGLDGNLISVGGYVNSMTYGPNGNLTQIVYANGTTTNYTYDPNRLWLNTANVVNGGTTLYTASYSYNAMQQVTSMTQGTPTGLTTNYTYDDLNRLTGTSGNQSQSLSYDALGNITYNSLVGNYYYTDAAHPHAVTSAGSANYTYDVNGNMLSGNGRTNTWDALGRLTSVTQADGATTFGYNDGSDRNQKTKGANTTLYFFSGMLDLVNGSAIQYYYAGPTLVAKKDASGNKTWYHADRLGSIRLMTNVSGAEVKDYDYRPFGDVLTTTGTMTNERGFTGQILDSETGLMYYNARYYDPKLSRFISADTATADENPQDLNEYSYCINNPVNSTDPTGHKWVQSGVAVHTVWVTQIVSTFIDIQIPYVIIIPHVEVTWIKHSMTTPTVYIPWTNIVAIPSATIVWYTPQVHVWFETKTGFTSIRQLVNNVIRVAHDVFTPVYRWVADAVDNSKRTVTNVWNGTIKPLLHNIANTKLSLPMAAAGLHISTPAFTLGSVFNAIGSAAQAVGHWAYENRDTLITIGLIIAVVALTVATGGTGAVLGAGLAARLMGGGISAAFAVGFDLAGGKSMQEAAIDGALQFGLGFASVGAGGQIGKMVASTKLTGLALKGAEFGAQMAFGFVKDTANNLGHGKSLGDSAASAAANLVVGGILTAGIVATPAFAGMKAGFNNPVAIGAATLVGNGWAQWNLHH